MERVALDLLRAALPGWTVLENSQTVRARVIILQGGIIHGIEFLPYMNKVLMELFIPALRKIVTPKSLL